MNTTPNQDISARVLSLRDEPSKQMHERPRNGIIVDVYFDGVIEEPELFRELFKKIRVLTDQDELHLHVSSPGGDVNTAIQIYHELMGCKARTVAHAYHAYSGATFLVLACDEIRVYQYGTFMCHNVAYGVQGKGSEAKTMVNFVNRTSETLIRDMYHGFLTTDEIDRILKDEDFWFDSDEMIARLKTWIPRRYRSVSKAGIWSTIHTPAPRPDTTKPDTATCSTKDPIVRNSAPTMKDEVAS